MGRRSTVTPHYDCASWSEVGKRLFRKARRCYGPTRPMKRDINKRNKTKNKKHKGTSPMYLLLSLLMASHRSLNRRRLFIEGTMSIVAAFTYDVFHCGRNQRRIAVAINVVSQSQPTTPFIKAYRLSSQLFLTTSFTAVATDDVASRSQPTILSAVRFEASSLPSRLSPTTPGRLKAYYRTGV